MKNYESIYISNNNDHKQYINTYFRYVHNIFILFKDTNGQTEVMVNSLYKNYKKCQFTLETLIGKEINFIDLTINKPNSKLF